MLWRNFACIKYANALARTEYHAGAVDNKNALDAFEAAFSTPTYCQFFGFSSEIIS